MIIKRAYSVLTIKSVDEDKGVIKGIATTPTADRMGDIVEPDGAKFTLPIPLLWQHNSSQPIGLVTEATVTKKGIEIVATISRGLTERIDEAWKLIKGGLVRGLSIGFSPIEYALLKDGGYRFVTWSWHELSAVTIPANAEASIQSIKSADHKTLAALGRGSPSRPGVSGIHKTGTEMPKTLAQKIAELTSAKAQHAAKLAELTKAAVESDGLMDTDDVSAMEEQKSAISAIDKNIAALKSVEDQQIELAQPVSKGAGGRSASPTILVKKADPDDAFAGQSFIRKFRCKTLARLDGDLSAAEYAKALYGHSHPNLVASFHAKAAVAGGGTGAGEWGAELASLDARYNGDFIEYLNGLTLFDKLGLRDVPARVTIKGQDGEGVGYWVGESKAIPMTKLDFSSVNLTPLKVAALTTLSKELLRDSSPAAEMLIRDGLATASAKRIDQTFLSDAAGVAGVSPAGILNGLTPLITTGVGASDVLEDIAKLYAPFIAANNTEGLVFVTTSGIVKTLSLMRTALEQRAFPEVSQGTLNGDRLVSGGNVPAGALILLKPSDIYKIGDGGIEVSLSQDATIEQDTAPTGASDTPAAATLNLVNMFQSDSVAVKVVRSMNFAKRRASAVSWMDDVAYAVAPTP